MRHIYTLVVVAGLAAAAACTGSKREDAKPDVDIQMIDDLPGIAETHGTIGDGTSMNVLEFIADGGDTMYVDMSSQSVMGGENVGDEVQLVYVSNDSVCQALIAVNLTALQHVWSQLGVDGTKQSLELNSGGRAATYDMSVEYDSWSVANGVLMLHSPKKVGDEGHAVVDTFDIMELNDDQLVLSHGHITTVLSRDN